MMKIYVVSLKKMLNLLAYLFITLTIFFSISIILSNDNINVFNTVTELPIYSVENSSQVSITFDCSGDNKDIVPILAALKKENVRATFFIIGKWAEKYPQTVKQIAEDGHDIANHTYSHLRLGGLGNTKIKSEIEQCTKTLETLTGKKSTLFRAPYGDFSSNVINIARNLGYKTIQWDVDSLDWKTGISKQQIVNRVENDVKSGSIILFHNDTQNTSSILPKIITVLKDRGFQIVPVSEMILE